MNWSSILFVINQASRKDVVRKASENVIFKLKQAELEEKEINQTKKDKRMDLLYKYTFDEQTQKEDKIKRLFLNIISNKNVILTCFNFALSLILFKL
jgi:hypothetical protein